MQEWIQFTRKKKENVQSVERELTLLPEHHAHQGPFPKWTFYQMDPSGAHFSGKALMLQTIYFQSKVNIVIVSVCFSSHFIATTALFHLSQLGLYNVLLCLSRDLVMDAETAQQEQKYYISFQLSLLHFFLPPKAEATSCR